MASMKSMINVVLDVGPTMGQFLPAQPGDASVVPRTKLDLAKGFIGHFFLQRMMASKTIELGVVTFGDDVTKNSLNTSMRGGYEHVHEVIKIAKPTVDTLSVVHGIRQGSFQGDLIDGIVTGQDALVRINAGKAFNRIMLLVTDGETRVEGIADLEQIVPQMQAMKNFALYIAMVGKVTDTSTVVKQENAKLLLSLAENTGGRFLDIEDLTESVHLLSAGLGLSTKPTLSKTFLELSPEMRVPCTYFNPVSAATLPSLKKRPVRQGGFPHHNADAVIGAAVKRDTSYRDPEDESMEIAAEERVKGYKYGATYIPVTTADEDSFKIAGPAGVTIIGFIDADRIPRHHFVDKAMLLLPTLDHAGAQRLFTSLILTLRRDKKVGLVRFVKREHSDPFLAALMPLPETAQGSDLGAQTNGLLVHRLPCAEDVRDYNFPSLVTFAGANRDPLRRQQQRTMSSFVDAITLSQPSGAQLTPANATLHAVYGAVHARLLQEVSRGRIAPESLFPVRDTFRCPQRPVSLLQAVEHAFPLEKTQKLSGKKRKIFWSELDLSTSTGQKNMDTTNDDDDNNQAAVEQEIAEEDARAIVRALAGTHAQAETKEPTLEPTLEPLPELPDFTIGSPTPLEDLDTLIGLLYQHAFPLSLRVQKSREAIQVMLKVVDRQVTVGACKAAYDKAVACLQTLRRVCLQVQDCAAFNAFLQMPCKAVHSKGRHALFWQLLKEVQMRPISSVELPQSTMSEVAAAAFFDGGPGGGSYGGSLGSSQVGSSQAPRAVPADEDDEAAFFSPWRK